MELEQSRISMVFRAQMSTGVLIIRADLMYAGKWSIDAREC
jgi:hypothetical protein